MKSLKPAGVAGLPSLQTKGLAILGVFMFIITAFFVLLLWNSELAEQESRQEEHYKIILKRTQGLVRPFFRGLEHLNKYVQDKDPEQLKRYGDESAEVIESLEWLKEQLVKDKECSQMLKVIDEKVRLGIDTMKKAQEKCESISDPEKAKIVFNDMKNRFQVDWVVMLNESRDLVIKEEQMVSKSLEGQRRARKLFKTLMVVSYVGVVVVVAMLVRFFYKEIIQRLIIMVEDTQKFRKGEELNPLMPAKDRETTLLNQAFHNMADEVREAQRMRQTFVAMISHDLRTPLTSVQGFLELVSIGAAGEVSEKTKTGAEIAERNVGRLIRLVSDLLDLEKMEAGKMQMRPKVIYIETVIEKSIQAIEEFATKHEVQLQCSETDAEVFADPDRLIQVVINLASNAIKFSPEGETVEIKTIESDEFVELQVIDHGRGVPAEYRDIIFEKYKQVKAEDGTQKGGTGLGLPICKLIIEQLGGTIGVTSESGKGSTFWFKLPKVSAEQNSKTEAVN